MPKRIFSNIVLAAAFSGTAACSNDATAPTAVATNSAATDSAATTATGGGYYGQPSTPRIRLIAILTTPNGGTFNHASGKAHWDTRNNNTKRELEMEVEHMPAGTQVDFLVDGTKYGSTATIDALGHASISLSTELGQTVPTAAAGLAAEVRTVGGAVVVAGIFPKS